MTDEKIDFAGAWFDIMNEYLTDREAFLQRVKNGVGVGVSIAPVVNSVDPAPGGGDGGHQLKSGDDLLVNEKVDDFAQKGVASDSHSKG